MLLKWEQRAKQNRLFEELDRRDREREKVEKEVAEAEAARTLRAALRSVWCEYWGWRDILTLERNRKFIQEDDRKYLHANDEYAVKTMDGEESLGTKYIGELNDASMLLKSKSGNQVTPQTSRTPLPTEPGSENTQKIENKNTAVKPGKGERRESGKRLVEDSEKETSPAKRYALGRNIKSYTKTDIPAPTEENQSSKKHHNPVAKQKGGKSNGDFDGWGG